MTGCGTKLMSSSKKRKHQQISPFAELHLRRSRSGRTLLDLPPKPSIQSPYVHCANSKHLIDENPEIFDVDERISIKDLRARRVFSLASTEQVDVEGNKKKLKSDVVIEGCDRDDCVQATPPDTAPDGLHVMKSLSSSNLNKNPKFKEKHTSFKGVLTPCSRTKLFKTPNSFSYRRLLPFLMDLSKEDNYNASGNRRSQKVEKAIEESPIPPLSGSQDIPEDGVNGVSNTKYPSGGSDASPTQELREMNSPNRSSHVDCLNSESTKHPLKESPEVPSTSPIDTVEENLETFDVAEKISIEDLQARRLFSLASIQRVDADDMKKLQSEIVIEVSDEDPRKNENNGSENSNCNGSESVQTTPPDTKTDGFHVLKKPSSNLKNPSKEISFSEKQKSPNSKGVLVPCSRTRLFKTPSSFSYKRLLPFLMDFAKDNVWGSRPSQMIEQAVEERHPSSPSVSQDILEDGVNKKAITKKYPSGGADDSPSQESREINSFNGSYYVDCVKLDSTENPFVTSGIEKLCENSVVVTNGSTELPLTESGIQNPSETSTESTVDGFLMTTPNDSLNQNALEAQQGVSDISSRLEPACNAINTHGTNSPAKSACSPVIPEHGLEPACNAINTHGTNSPAKSACSPVIPEHVSIKEGMTGDPSHLLMKVEDDCRNLLPNCSRDISPGALDVHQSTSNTETSNPLEKLVSDPSKGILKRYPRGCRGPCDCLACASFHLHAEKAFEFSRNQMQDAEDLALGLMNELSYLQNLLEKSVDGTKCHAVVQVSQLQLKEACNKAYIAQELAKRRIGEMNNELNFHCRIPAMQRPRVRFAHTAEVSMPRTDDFQASDTKRERRGSDDVNLPPFP